MKLSLKSVFWCFLIASSLVCQFAAPTTARANTLFEGWYEVLLGGKKVGFMVERYEFNNGKFVATTYLKTNTDGNDVTESLKAFAAPDLGPLGYQYTTKIKDEVKLIDATFKGQVGTFNITDGKKKHKETKRFEKGTFLSTFLIYLILANKNALTVGNNYNYIAIAEEDGTAQNGTALVVANDKVKGRDAYKLKNDYKGESFLTWLSPKGEILYVKSPEKALEMRFAENQAAATKGVMANMKDLTFLFGTLPGDFGARTVDQNAQTLTAGKPTAPAVKGATTKKSGKGAPPSDDNTVTKVIDDGPAAPVAPSGDAQNPGNGVEIKGAPPPKTNKKNE